jgi:hypothetical protein
MAELCKLTTGLVRMLDKSSNIVCSPGGNAAAQVTLAMHILYTVLMAGKQCVIGFTKPWQSISMAFFGR